MLRIPGKGDTGATPLPSLLKGHTHWMLTEPKEGSPAQNR